jgi:hypothetical protein
MSQNKAKIKTTKQDLVLSCIHVKTDLKKAVYDEEEEDVVICGVCRDKMKNNGFISIMTDVFMISRRDLLN